MDLRYHKGINNIMFWTQALKYSVDFVFSCVMKTSESFPTTLLIENVDSGNDICTEDVFILFAQIRD